MRDRFLLVVLFALLFSNCSPGGAPDQTQATPPRTIIAFIEIPAGTNEKWEVDAQSGLLVRDSINGEPRVIDYLPYPFNYGFIPNTLLSKEAGGDGDPLDILVLGPALERGSTVQCKLIGVLWATDEGEQDDKLIALPLTGPMSQVEGLSELHRKYPGVTNIIENWFANYKGQYVMELRGFGNAAAAHVILDQAKR